MSSITCTVHDCCMSSITCTVHDCCMSSITCTVHDCCMSSITYTVHDMYVHRLVGALYGRIIGVLMTTMFGVHSEDSGYWAWIDPGVFSLIGAASFFGGVTRLTLAVTVIMVCLESA